MERDLSHELETNTDDNEEFVMNTRKGEKRLFNRGEEEKCFEILGTKHVLRKPVSLSELCAHLDMLTNKRLEYKMEERKELVRRKVTMGECNQNTRNTILVVEDDTFVASIISQFVQSAGYSTINAYTIAQVYIYYILYILYRPLRFFRSIILIFELFY